MRSSLRKRKPWIVVLIIIIAAIMVLPLYDVINVVGQMGDERQEQSFDLGDYVNDLKERAVNLESFLENNEPTPAILKELSSLYENISYFSDTEEEQSEYIGKAIKFMEKAIELEPGDAEIYLSLYELYRLAGDFDKATEAATTGETLVLERLEQEPDDNESRLQYSRFLANHHYDINAAIKQLSIILDSEPEDSAIYNNAQMELERLMEQKEAQEESALELEPGEENLEFDDGQIEAIIGDETEE